MIILRALLIWVLTPDGKLSQFVGKGMQKPKLLPLSNVFRYSSINAVTRPAPVLWIAQMLTQVASKFAQYCLIKATESAAFCQKMMMFAYLSCASVFSQILITERIKTVGTRGLFC